MFGAMSGETTVPSVGATVTRSPTGSAPGVPS